MQPQDKTGINDETGLPHSMTLSEVFDNIRLAPHEIASLLSHFGAAFAGGPQAGLQTKLQNVAARIVNPDTFSNAPQRAPADPRDVDPITGREFTPRRSDVAAPNEAPSAASLNPGGFTSTTAVPVDEPARPVWQQREPGAENPQSHGNV